MTEKEVDMKKLTLMLCVNLVIVLSVIVPLMVMYVDYRTDIKEFNPQMTDFPLVSISLQVVWRDDTVSDFQFENNHTLVMNDENDKYVTFVYSFQLENLNLTPFWSDIFLYFRIEDVSFLRFPYLECRYYIENHSEILRKDSFYKSQEGFNFYICKVDIDRWMFKNAVPTALFGQIKLFTN